MARWRELTIGCALALAGAIPLAAAQTPPAFEARTDRLIVKFRGEADDRRPRIFTEAKRERLSARAAERLSVHRQMSGGAHLLRLDRRRALHEVEAIARRLREDPDVLYAVPDRILRPQFTPNDALFSQQWYLQPSGQGGINAPGAWDFTTGAAPTVVAVIDTGILPHADLAGRTVPGYDFVSDPVRANDGGGRDSDPTDPGDWVTAAEAASGPLTGCAVQNSSWHGTRLAGVIAATGNNAAGIAGLNWVARILPVRAVGKCGAVLSDVLDAMRWAAGLPVAGVPNNANPAKVINLSLATPGTCDPAFQAAIDEVTNTGAIVVAAAGNQGQDAGSYSPASCNNVIAVGAVDHLGGLAPYSNTGPQITVSAPGGSAASRILSTSDSGTQGRANDNAYLATEGTSLAAAQVSGVVSLLLTHAPSMTVKQARDFLRNTARPFPTGVSPPSFANCTTALCGSGILDASAAVRAAPPVVAPRQVLSANNDAVVALRSDGTVWLWASSIAYLNPFPQQESELGAVMQLALRDGDGAPALALRHDGTVWTWLPGYPLQPPERVPGPGGVGVLGGMVAVAIGSGHALALKSDGTVWAWGYSSHPEQVQGLSNVTAIAAGRFFSLAIKADGTLWAWGQNDKGQLGDGTTTDRFTPVQVRGPGGVGFLQGVAAITAGSYHVLAAKSDGTLWAWGYNFYGQLGDGSAVHSTTTDRSTPVQVRGPGGAGFIQGVTAVAAGDAHSLAVMGDGTVQAWGSFANGVLGDGSTTSRSTPGPVTGLSGAVSVAAGRRVSLALKADGTMRAWGIPEPSGYHPYPPGAGFWLGGGVDTVPPLVRENYGAVNFSLGPPTPGEFAPRIEAPRGGVVSSNTITLSGIGPNAAASITGGEYSVNAGAYTSAAGTVNEGDRVTLRQTASPGSGTTTTAVLTAGALTRSFSVSSYTGDTTPLAFSFSPQTHLAVASNEQFVSSEITVHSIDTPVPISVSGGEYSVNGGAFTSNSGAVVAGNTVRVRVNSSSDPNGQSTATLTIGGVSASFSVITQPPSSFNAPRQVRLSSANEILAVRSDGSVWKWSSYYDPHPFPQQESSLGAIVQVALAGNTSTPGSLNNNPANALALRAGGTVWAWTPLYPNSSPVPVPGPGGAGILDGMTAVAVGANHFLALKSDGTVWTWGLNYDGQLGDGTLTDRATPAQVPDLGNVTAIAAGDSFSLALKADGTLWTWGSNQFRQLGDGTLTTRRSPVQVRGPGGTGFLQGITAIAGGAYHVLALKSDGSLWAWGRNSQGQLGDGSTTDRSTPVQVRGQGGAGFLQGVAAIAAGTYHSLAGTIDGTAQAWGLNNHGQLGDGTATNRSTPIAVAGLTGVESLAAGQSVSVALKADGTLRAWGKSDGYHTLPPGTGFWIGGGIDTVPPLVRQGYGGASFSVGPQVPGQFAPLIEAPLGSVQTSNRVTLVGISSGTGVSITGGDYSVNGGAFTVDAGTVNEGDRVTVRQTASASNGTTTNTVLAVGGVTKTFSVSSYTGDTTPAAFAFNPKTHLAVAPNGQFVSSEITVSGIDAQAPISVAGGEYSVNGGAFTSSPGTVASGNRVRVRVISAGAHDTLSTATLTIGGVSSPFSVITQPPPSFNAPRQVRLSGGDGVAALRSDGTVWKWGSDYDPHPFPQQVGGLGGIVQLTNALALRSGGTVWTWSPQSSGSVVQVPGPGGVGALEGIVAIAGYHHSLALKSDGTVWSWGLNWYGQLGDGTLTDRSTPVQVSGLSQVSAIAAGNGFSLALKADGTVWAWGLNAGVQLGDGTRTNRSSPVQVRGQAGAGFLQGVVAIATGGGHVLALKSDGTLWAWGNGRYGRLGDGNAGESWESWTPVQVLGQGGVGFLQGVTAIAAGASHSLAVMADGTAWAWGYNEQGQLGDGTTTSRSTPVPVTGLNGVASLDAGNTISVALKADGTLRIWGNPAGYHPGPPGTGFSSGGLDTVPPLVRDWYGAASFSLGPPTPGEFGPLIEAPRSVVVTSNTVTLAGIGANTAVNVTGGEYSVNGGAFTTAAGTVSDGDRVTLRQTTSSSYGTTTAAVLGVGALTKSFNVSSYSGDVTPAAFSFNPQTHLAVAPGAQMVSNPTTVGGMDAPVPISVAGGEYSVNGGAFTTVPGTVVAGNTVRVRVNASAAYDTQRTVTLTIGEGPGAQQASFSLITRPAAPVVAPRQVRLGPGNDVVAVRSDGTVWVWASYYAYPLPQQVSSLGAILQAAPGALTANALALRAGGTVWAWSPMYGSAPVQVPGPGGAGGLDGTTAIAVGAGHHLALKSDGTVWAWGANQSGQLGDGTTTERPHPVQVQGLSNVTAIAASGFFSLARKADGTLWAWGFNDRGQLGDGTTAHRLAPGQVRGQGGAGFLQGVVAIAAGEHVLALKADGTVWAWGRNDSGQLGEGSTTDRLTPTQVRGLDGVGFLQGVTAIAAGSYHSLAVLIDGTVRVWGYNEHGQLGDGTTLNRSTPVPAAGLTGIESVTAGTIFSLALKTDGTMRAWGGYGTGFFNSAPPGTGVYGGSTLPQEVKGGNLGGKFTLDANPARPNSFQFEARFNVARGAVAVSNPAIISGNTVPAPVSVSGGEYSINGGPYTSAPGTVSSGNTLTLRQFASALYGATTEATVTVGGVSAIFYVVSERDPAADIVTPRVSAGESHTLLLRPDGTLWGFGYNANGQLGNGSTFAASAPRRVAGLTNVTAVAAGRFHTLALRSDKTVWAFGWNSVGQLGDGTTDTTRLAPVQVPGLTNVKAIAAGYAHSLAVKEDRTVWAWGSNTSGQLGDGTTTGRATPVQVPGISDAVAVAAGERHSVVLLGNGTLLAWGANESGQLGDGGTLSRLTPVAISITGVAQIAAGNAHTLALKTNGSLHAWGGNFAGQLGDGGSADRAVPGPVSSMGSDVTAIAAGANHSVAVRSGQLYTWGANDNGQLGDGETLVRRAPYLVTGMIDIDKVAAGGGHTVTLSTANVLRAFGDNLFGQVGNRTGNFSLESQVLDLLRGDLVISQLLAAATTSVGATSTTGSSAINTDALEAAVSFGAVTVGSATPPQARKFINGSSQTYVSVQVSIVTATGAEFSINTNTCAAGNIAPNAECQVQVAHAPPAPGIRSGELVFVAVSADGQSLTTRVPLVSIATAAGGPLLSLTPAGLAFGSQGTGTTSVARGVSLTSIGSTALDVSAIVIGGADAAQFGSSHNCPASLAPATSCAVSVTFSPGTLGDKAAVLSVTSNAPGSPLAVELTGNGAPPGLGYTPVLVGGFNLIGNSLDITLDVTATFGNQGAPVAGVTEKIISVWKWNAAAGKWAFRSPQLTGDGNAAYAASRNYDLLIAINPGEGYWVNAIEAVALPAQSGNAFGWSTINFSALPSGFNLITSASDATPSQFNAQVNATPPAPGAIPTENFVTLWVWDAVLGKWYFHSPILEASGGLPAVKAYADSHNYLHFQDPPGKTLGVGTGFWVNRP